MGGHPLITLTVAFTFASTAVVLAAELSRRSTNEFALSTRWSAINRKWDCLLLSAVHARTAEKTHATSWLRPGICGIRRLLRSISHSCGCIPCCSYYDYLQYIVAGICWNFADEIVMYLRANGCALCRSRHDYLRSTIFGDDWWARVAARIHSVQ